ncbi:MAG TPA: DNA polymerase III subunit beta [Candidatus Saccharimonadales bacterium]|jgi:DNA polymerase-3 subunit beta|nr:DNA polymerase III subunit beta [Candidatus Saccharimonadales bacterium]
MKLQVTQENLNKALSNVARVANARSTLPILANVMIRTIGNRVSISATNLDIAITHFIGSKVEKEGSITVPARLMQDFINSLPPGTISLELENHKLHITTNTYQSVINGVAAEEFPVMPAITKGQKVKLPSSTFKLALQQVIFAASSDEARPVLTGLFLHDFENALYLVATDSYRLAEKKLVPTKQAASLLIPASALSDLLRVLGDSDSEVQITYDGQQVLFQVDDIELVTRLIDGNYPDYRKLIPDKFSVIATVKKDELLSITKVSSLFARENAGSVTIKVDQSAKSVSIHSIASQLGENTASTTGDIKGSGEITLNSRYLLDALHAFSGEDISFCFNGKLEPSALKDPSNNEYVHVIMPLKS